MCLFAIGIEHPLDMTVQRLHLAVGVALKSAMLSAKREF
jgi:hypothetical protein